MHQDPDLVTASHQPGYDRGPEKAGRPCHQNNRHVSTFHEKLYADLLLFFAGRVRVAHTRQWERTPTSTQVTAVLDMLLRGISETGPTPATANPQP
jgi:hypothetical protein